MKVFFKQVLSLLTPFIKKTTISAAIAVLEANGYKVIKK